jgi:hypothetical protein
MAYFRSFSNVISIKTSRAARKKYLQYGGHPSMTSSRDVTASPLLQLMDGSVVQYGFLTDEEKLCRTRRSRVRYDLI